MGALTGLKVVDCSWGTAGPRATGMMAEFGADVVRVEPPGGDPFREALAVEYSVYNRGKRSIIVDLKSAEGRDRVLALASGADVFVESWRPGVAERLGLDPNQLHAREPGLVVCSITGFGRDGPNRDRPGYESLVHAVVGSMGEQAGVRDGPIFEALPFASFGAAHLAVIGMLAALYRRERDGIGRVVETSLLDGALAFLAMLWGDFDIPVPRPTARSGNRMIVDTVRCGDGEYLGVHTGAVGAFGRAMKALGLDDRIPPSESGLDMALPLTADQQAVLDEELPKAFASKPRQEWLETLLANDVCAIPVLRPTQVFDEPQALHNEMVITVVDPVLGPVQQVAPAARLALTPAAVTGPAPAPGQHTDEVLAEAGRPAPVVGPNRVEVPEPVLGGVRVLDFGAYYAGPYASRLLADLGAEVIKLEPLKGDPLRGQPRVFPSGHAGKRSLALDLKQEEAQRIGRALVGWADIVTHNMRPGAAERLGLGYEQARTVKPDIIYGYSPGWGSTGPDRQRQGFAPMYSGYCGNSLEVAGRGNPPVMPLGNEDPGNGLVGAVGLLVALLHRERTGRGQLVEHPQLNATMSLIGHIVRRPDGTLLGAGKLDPDQMGTSPRDRLHRTADGWICVVGEPGALPLATMTTHDAERAVEAAGIANAVPVPYNNEAFLNDPENLRSGRVAQTPHPTNGRIREVAKLIRISHGSDSPHRRAPALGEHSDEILAMLGYSEADIEQLCQDGVVR